MPPPSLSLEFYTPYLPLSLTFPVIGKNIWMPRFARRILENSCASNAWYMLRVI